MIKGAGNTMKKRTEETPLQKIIVILVEISLAAIFIGIAIVLDFSGGGLLCLPFIGSVIFEFFRKDGQNITFKSTVKDTTPYDGELVSYQEYPENHNGVNNSQGFDKYRKNNHDMDDLYSGRK